MTGPEPVAAASLHDSTPGAIPPHQPGAIPINRTSSGAHATARLDETTRTSSSPASPSAHPVAATGRAGALRRMFRMFACALHLVRGLLTVGLIYPLVGTGRRQALRCHWSRGLLRILGVRLEARGVPIQPGSMLVANHVSWVDVFVINALAPSAFVSKAEVRDWPAVGWLAAQNETVFLRRGSRGHARIINAEIGAILDAGHNVALFPEGTTTDGTHVQHFHAALLQPAIASGHAIQPVAIRYRHPDGRYCAAPAYHGDISLGQCLAAIIGQTSILARVDIGDPIDTADGTHRRELARIARDAIVHHVGGESNHFSG